MAADFLDLDFAVRPQIDTDDLQTLKDQGFKSIFCHRPDNEEEGQPEFSEIAQRARALGLEAHHLPVTPNAISQADHAAFQTLLKAAPKPILAYCKTGGRAKILWTGSNPSD